MSTRKRSKRDRTSSKSSHESPTSLAKEKHLPSSSGPDHVAQSDLPPSRSKPMLRSVSPPGYGGSLRYFIYTLVTTALLFTGWYTYITAVGLKHWKEEVGWWGMSVGRFGRQDSLYWNQRRGHEVKAELEEHFSQLASSLGISATDLASAVKPFVPSATLSSIAPQAKGEAVKVLFEESHQNEYRGDSSGNTVGS
ncbi:hypothetical protein DEU56DRAFT_782925 [Suillus clintonianus]|uniref:uncharacterized protein n=1 Tax=Suillus clintonianus TaxID=1904413 RepID=UPI001B86B322|nr:uncharacterized protein DEU56DRAFT_782925 [Suillus clintonianus]KAG2148924.1 hypothetical protein DEU56DRAFT_782925 [Suillus clintonianus]